MKVIQFSKKKQLKNNTGPLRIWAIYVDIILLFINTEKKRAKMALLREPFGRP